jgi:hypothetical protein
MTWKGFGKKIWPNFCSITAFTWRVWGHSWNTLVRAAGTPVGIPLKHLPNICLACHGYDSLCCLVVRVPACRTEMYCVSCEVQTEFLCYVEESWPPQWYSGQSSWLQNGNVLCFLWGTNWIFMLCRRKLTASVVSWSEFLATERRSVVFPVRYELNFYVMQKEVDRDLMLDCWLVVSLHPEGPVTGQLDQEFPWFSLVPEQMLCWYPNSTLHCMLPMQPSQW